MKSVSKRLIILLLVALLITACLPSAYAKNGDIAGNYYYTDIKTYMYHSLITSYNIGGKTVIDAEILNWHYNFDVYWHADTRTLELLDKGGMFNSLQAESGELCKSAGGVPGKTAGHYYKTDIIATLNGTAIESYNIGGRTCIAAEEMRTFGYNVTWNAEKRTLTITKPADFYSIDTDYGTIKTMNNYERPDISFAQYNRGILLENSDGTESELATPSGYVLFDSYGVSYVRLSDLCAVLNADCTLQQTTAETQRTWPDGTSTDETEYVYSFNLTYDPDVEVTLKPAQADYPQGTPERQPGGKCYSDLRIDVTVNGAEGQFWFKMGGKEYGSGILILDNVIYVPTYTAAKWLGYFAAE